MEHKITVATQKDADSLALLLKNLGYKYTHWVVGGLKFTIMNHNRYYVTDN